MGNENTWCGCDAFRPLWWWAEVEMPALGPEDEDVSRERERVKAGKAQNDILTMKDLSKVQPTAHLQHI